jgi:HK97 gp10 family phage protein
MSDLVVNEDNTERVVSGIDAALHRALETCGLVAEGYAKKLCPVDTGNLRNSITHVTEGDSAVYVGTNTEYAAYVELGTSRTRAQPYLRPAVERNSSTYKQIIKGAMQNG